jgi:hypothetical protein
MGTPIQRAYQSDLVCHHQNYPTLYDDIWYLEMRRFLSLATVTSPVLKDQIELLCTLLGNRCSPQ